MPVCGSLALSSMSTEVPANMSSVIEAPKVSQTTAQPWFKWLPIVAGLLVMYVPSYLDLSRTFWDTEVGGHGPIILAVVIWLFWRQREVLLAPAQGRMPKTGWALIVFGLLSYILGRSQEVFQLEVGSQIPLLLGIVLALQGKRAAKSLWFPIFFLCFLVPIPGSVLDFVLLPLKKYVSIIVENLLYLFGYPIGRTGVVLTIGPYQLLIADACSGLNSMIALSAVGVLFAYLINSDNRAYNAILLASILPIADIHSSRLRPLTTNVGTLPGRRLAKLAAGPFAPAWARLSSKAARSPAMPT